jgi:hypothetical protein
MPDRKPRLSDVVDICISSAFPYVNYILTENNLATDIKQIKNKKLFFTDIEVLTIRDLKKLYILINNNER